MAKAPEQTETFQSLVQIVAQLRNPVGGCPWDLEQTHLSLTRNAIEEVYEMVEAIDLNNDKMLKEELGDVLLQVVLHSQIAKDRGAFQIEDVLNEINTKLIRRHPHVFGDGQAHSADEALQNWKDSKKKEKNLNKKKTEFNIPKGTPSLQVAEKIGQKTNDEKFDWDNADQVFLKLKEEVGELEVAMKSGDRAELIHELGDVFFSAAQIARHLKVDPEQASREANRRFEMRYFRMLEFIEADNLNLKQMSLEQKEAYWKKSKDSFGK